MGGDVDDYHGELIADPYRWLETTTDPETVNWIKAENELTDSYLAAVPASESIREQLTGLWNYPRAGVPFERGGGWFQSRNPGLAAQPVLYVMDQPGETGRVLLDPGTRSAVGTTAVSAVSVSDDGTLLAYATSGSGSDRLTWRVRDVATGEDLADVIEWSKFSGAAWRGDGSGFFYAAMQPASAGAEYLEANAPSRILFHQIGTPQDADEVVFAAPDEPDWMPSAEVTEDGRFLVVTIKRAAGFETQLHVLDLRDPAARLRPVIGDFESVNVVVTSVGTMFYLVTDHDAERKRLVAVDLESPGRGNWREIIGESDDTLESAYHYGGQLVCHYPGRAFRAACPRAGWQLPAQHPAAWPRLASRRGSSGASLGHLGPRALGLDALQGNVVHRVRRDLAARPGDQPDAADRAVQRTDQPCRVRHRAGTRYLS